MSQTFLRIEPGYLAFRVFGYGLRCKRLPWDFVPFSERGKEYPVIFGWQIKLLLRGKL